MPFKEIYLRHQRREGLLIVSLGTKTAVLIHPFETDENTNGDLQFYAFTIYLLKE